MWIEKFGETIAHFITMMEEVLENSFPVDIESDMRSLVTDYDYIFREKLGAGKPANVTPMEVILKIDYIPVIVRVRKYSPPKAEFTRKSQLDSRNRTCKP